MRKRKTQSEQEKEIKHVLRQVKGCPCDQCELYVGCAENNKACLAYKKWVMKGGTVTRKADDLPSQEIFQKIFPHLRDRKKKSTTRMVTRSLRIKVRASE